MTLRKLIFGFLLLVNEVEGQHEFNGVYYGKFITTKNALVISAKDSIVSGSIYLDEYERLTFSGLCKRDTLKGVFFQNGQPKIVIGTFYRDTLQLDLISDDGIALNHGSLVKVSKNIRYDVTKLLGKDKPEHDPELIGSWLAIKSINGSGKDLLREKHEEEYIANGIFSIRSPTLDKVLNSSKAKPFLLPRYSWETKSGKVIIKRHASPPVFPESDENIYPYQIKGDTLIVVNPKTRAYFIRKK